MSKTTFSLDDLRQRAAQRKGGDKLTITIDGKPFTIPIPGFWPDEIKALARSSKDQGDGPFVTALLGGQKEYQAFVAAGGRSDDIGLLLDEYRAGQGADLGESSPSPTS